MSSVSVVSTSSQSFASGEDSAEDVVLAILRPRPVLTLPLLDTGFSLQQTLINKRSTILLTPPSARPRNFDNIFIAPDSAPPFADTFRICSEDEKDADTSMQESWDGEWSREDMKEVQAKLRKLRTT
ncbi:hypothetical protein L218DRAFT_953985 [Marasmius fiardii PR-910]|nr:hypothetical protein L218DRAFT_953985 [Marasmius fiardii PR-910]